MDTQNDSPNSFDLNLLDGAAVVHLLPITNVVTFDEYAKDVFIPYIIKQLGNSKRVDIVQDTYIPSSIKESTREKKKRVVGERLQVKNCR